LLQSGVNEAGLVINTNNNVAIGAVIPLTKLDVSGNLLVRAYGTSGSGTRGIFFRSDHITTNLQYNCSILTFDHGGGGPTDGLSINGFGGVSFCTGANTRQERMRISSTGALSFTNNVWHQCLAGNRRIYFESNATTYIEGYGGTPIVFRNGNDTGIGNINSSGDLSVNGFLFAGSYIYTNGFLQGAGGGGAYRILRYDNWVRLMNTAQNLHLDFAAGKLYAHYELDVQGASTFNNNVYFNGYTVVYNTLQVRLTNISSTNTDYVCVAGNTGFNSVNDKALYIANGTFTGFHRNYTDDELFDVENPDIFKNNFVGCIVISTGKIKTDYSTITEDEGEDEVKKSSVEWKSAIDKEGIFIEDALPIVKLSRVKKDKRVFGVVGDPTRSNNSKERLIINSVGEGAICVCNTNGNIENGDYIQSSDVLGHGEKQDDDILHNYTVAKATIDCNFELNSPYYECIERPDGIRTAFIACTYHCG
jgi:hypothetical protein